VSLKRKALGALSSSEANRPRPVGVLAIAIQPPKTTPLPPISAAAATRFPAVVSERDEAESTDEELYSGMAE
jgi:hypothetical protein